MKINMDEVNYISKLAKLKLDNEEAKKMVKEFNSILEHFENLDNENLEDIDVNSFEDIKSVLRKDKNKKFNNTTKLFQNAKDTKDTYIKVPKIID